ncbi:hypothetical protein TspCOW1_09850 [Thiohalobacter sp. COW1]|nr:hypothetical protein TspCOW1_09850 [Thiohalobacter sp. COW1]
MTVLPGIDGYTGASPRTHIYTSQAAKEAAETAFQADPDAADIEDTLWINSPAAVYFELDDGSGRPPGIQVVTDDLDFPTNNCIMASGERESADFPGTIVPKLCSDPPSSSKRYFLEIRKADVPVDLVFDVGMKDIRYKGVKDPEDDGGEALEAFREEYGIGRIYRVIQKVINNSDERWVGVNVEVGHGVGSAFERFNFAEDGIAFELRNLVPREFFEGETGAPDIEVWDPTRYATYSPKLFDDGSRERFDPGFFDDEAGGLFPPQATSGDPEKTPFIFSGTDAKLDGSGSYGAITLNHFSMVDTQAVGSGIPQGVFGYVLSDSLAPYVIARYDDGDPEAESDAVEAWWDGADWRYGLAGSADGLTGPFETVPDAQLTGWASKLLGLEPTEGDTVRYDSILGDDFATQNMDVYIYISDGILDEAGEPKFDNITLRVTGVSVDAAGLAGQLGTAEPAWIDNAGENNFESLLSYLITDEPAALNDLETMYENDPTDANFDPASIPLNIDVLANDVFNGELIKDSGDVTVDSVQITVSPDAAVGTAVVNTSGAFPTIDFTPAVGFTGLATFKYTVTVSGTDSGGGAISNVVSNEATVAVRVNAFPDPEAPVAANDSAVTFKDTSVTIDVLANDTLPTGTPDVKVLDEPLAGSVVVQNNELVYTPATGFVGLDRFTYTVTVNGKTSNAALITVRVDDPEDITEDESSSGNGGGGCTLAVNGRFDPTLPLILAAMLGVAGWRRFRTR